MRHSSPLLPLLEGSLEALQMLGVGARTKEMPGPHEVCLVLRLRLLFMEGTPSQVSVSCEAGGQKVGWLGEGGSLEAGGEKAGLFLRGPGVSMVSASQHGRDRTEEIGVGRS